MIHAYEFLAVDKEFAQVADSGPGFEDPVAYIRSHLANQPPVEAARFAKTLQYLEALMRRESTAQEAILEHGPERGNRILETDFLSLRIRSPLVGYRHLIEACAPLGQARC